MNADAKVELQLSGMVTILIPTNVGLVTYYPSLAKHYLCWI